jgi:hypothetical protein
VSRSNRHPAAGHDVIMRAERIVQRQITSALNRAEMMEQECRAVAFRDRWRYVGVTLGVVILVVGMGTTSDKAAFLNFGWIAGAGLSMLAGVIIGHFVYRKRSPW